jgi:AcrR family transcriptional regulator
VDAFRIRDVAEAAGVSQPLVSRHFRSRDELVLEAFVACDERALALLAERAAEAPAGPERVLAYIAGTFDEGDDLQDSWTLWREVANQREPSAAMQEAMVRRHREWLDAIRDYVLEGQEAGAIAAEVEAAEAAQFLSIVVDGLHPALRLGVIDRATVDDVLRRAVRDRLGGPG